MKSLETIMFSLAVALTAQSNAQEQPMPPNHEQIKAQLGWMIGTWERTTEDGDRHQFECEWILDKQFMQGTVRMGTPPEHMLHVLVGWNPLDKGLTVAGYNKLGGQSAGKFIKAAGNEVHFALKGVSIEGPVSLTLVYSHPADDRLIVEYRDWTVGGEKQEPLNIEFRRKTD